MARIELSADLVVNLPRPGDTGDGTPNNPYDSIQRAIDDPFANYDLAGFEVTIKLQAGVRGSATPYIFYRGARLSGRFVGQSGQAVPLLNMPGEPPFIIGAHGPVRIVGSLDPTYPEGAFIFPLPADGAAISLSECSSLSVDGVGMDTSRTRQDCIDVFQGAFLNLGNIRFGNAGPVDNLFCNHISAAFSACIYISGKITQTGSAGSFATIGSKAALYWNNNGDPGYQIPFEHIGNPTYRDAFLQCDNGIIYAHAVAFSGAAVGKRYSVMRNGVISTNSPDPNYLPGNVPGTVQSGGQYT